MPAHTMLIDDPTGTCVSQEVQSGIDTRDGSRISRRGGFNTVTCAWPTRHSSYLIIAMLATLANGLDAQIIWRPFPVSNSVSNFQFHFRFQLLQIPCYCCAFAKLGLITELSDHTPQHLSICLVSVLLLSHYASGPKHIQALQIQEVHLGPHANAWNFIHFSYLFCLGHPSLLGLQTKTRR